MGAENNNTDLEKETKLIISGITGLSHDKISTDAHMYNEIGIDSIKGIELVVAIQEKYGIRVSDEKIPQLTTVKLIAEEIKRLLSKETKN